MIGGLSVHTGQRPENATTGQLDLTRAHHRASTPFDEMTLVSSADFQSEHDEQYTRGDGISAA